MTCGRSLTVAARLPFVARSPFRGRGSAGAPSSRSEGGGRTTREPRSARPFRLSPTLRKKAKGGAPALPQGPFETYLNDERKQRFWELDIWGIDPVGVDYRGRFLIPVYSRPQGESSDS